MARSSWASTCTGRSRSDAKESGAVWALERLPAEHRRPLELALESYRTHGRDLELELERTEFDAYAQVVAEEVRLIHPQPSQVR